MVKESLVDARFESGESLLRRLDAKGIPVTAAFWLRMSEEDDWRLVLASPLVDELGPKASYQRVQSATAPLLLDGISLADISLLSPKHDIIKLMGHAVGTGPAPSISGIRFSSGVINNAFIYDAYIYRMAP